MQINDTIVAQATPPGRGGVGILRVSGPKAAQVAEIVLGKLLNHVMRIICHFVMRKALFLTKVLRFTSLDQIHLRRRCP